MKNLSRLQRKVKIMMIDSGLDKRGGQTDIAQRLNITVSSLNMALTGYRSGAASERILLSVIEALKQ
jgi:hypothetical protein